MVKISSTAKAYFSCYLIGEDSLLISCASLLLESKHNILGIISSNFSIHQWAKQKRIPYYSCLKSAKNALKKEKFDYLFSIVNSQILPKEILRLPQKFAINYHDSPLPRYAGVHATSWAILSNEPTHAITWHVVDELVDAGDILKQVSFSISKTETVFTLNLKCYQKAVEAFSELIVELSNSSYQRIPQDMSERTYNAYSKKPSGNGCINWRDSAENIERICRALQFGKHKNDFALPKIKINKGFFLLHKIQISDQISHHRSGTIVKISDGAWHIATSTKNIIIKQIKTITGGNINLKTVVENYKLKEGGSLPLISMTDGKEIEDISTQFFEDENFWADQWEKFEFSPLPFLSTTSLPKSTSLLTPLCKLSISPTLIRKLRGVIPEGVGTANALIAIWLIYLKRLSDNETVGTLFSYPELSILNAGGLNSLFANELPCLIKFKERKNFEEILRECAIHIRCLQKRQSHLLDIKARYPKLPNIDLGISSAVWFTDKSHSVKHIRSNASFALAISTEGDELTWFIDKSLKQENSFLLPSLKNIPKHIHTLIEAIIESPEKNIEDLPLIDKKEYDTLIYKWAGKKTSYPEHATLQGLFEAQVNRTPNNIAIVQEDRTLTYAELNARANQLAHYLHQQYDIKLEICVGICLERNVEMIIAIMGIIKAGGGYVPIDPDYPQSRIQLMANDSDIKVIITSAEKYDHLSGILPSINLIDLNSEILRDFKGSLRNPSIKTTSQSLAYIMYTSGSTGQPKGIEVVHRGVVRLVKNTNYAKFTEKDCVAFASNPAFDASTFEIWSALLNGGKLCIFSNATVYDMQQFTKDLRIRGVTTIWLNAALFNQLIKWDKDFLKNLKTIFFGGESPSQSLIQALKNRVKSNCRLVHIYGPTENTSFSTSYEVSNFFEQKKFLSIGKPISNTYVYILGKNLQPLPIGSIGELYLAGAGLARGYRNNIPLNQEKFLKNVLANAGNENLYKTGDFVRWLPTGELEFIGRIDNQIKIRGFRIELLEIEACLLRCKLVQDAKVILCKDNRNQSKLVAFLIRRTIKDKQNSIIMKEIKSFLTDRLPSYMHPSHFHMVSSFPYNTNGKIDALKLIQDFQYDSQRKKIIFKPKDDVQKLLVQIWEAVFGKKTSIKDNFFELGGDSIVAMQIVAKAREYGIKFDIKSLFQYPSVSLLSQTVTKSRDDSYFLEKVASKKDLFTPIQKWFFKQDFFNNDAFSHACLIRIKNLINPNLLNACLKNLLLSHKAFRVRFFKEGAKWFRSVTPQTANLSEIIKEFNIVELNYKQKKTFIEKLTTKGNDSLDIEKGKLSQFYIIKLNDKNDYNLLMIIHHLIIDGVSWRIILDWINKYLDKGVISLTDSSKHKNNFDSSLEAIERYIISAKDRFNKDFWLKVIKKNFSIPTDYIDGKNLVVTSDTVKTKFTKNETCQLNSLLHKSIGINIHEFLVAVTVRVFSDWCQKNEVVLDLESHGRSNVYNIDMSDTVGWFTSLFPLRFSYNKENKFEENIGMVRNVLRNIPNEGIDYSILRYSLEDSDFEGVGNSAISFNYWGILDIVFPKKSKMLLEDLRLVSNAQNKRTHLINIEPMILRGQLKINFSYSQDIYRKETISDLSKKYQKFIRDFISKDLNLPLILKRIRAGENNALSEKCVKDRSIKNEIYYPLSSMQKGIFYHALSFSGCEAYSVQCYWKLDESIKTDLLHKSLKILVDSVSVLRTTFKYKGLKEPLQSFSKNLKLSWHEYTWSDAEFNKNAVLDEFLKADRQRGFSFDENDQSSLFRAILIKSTGGRRIIVISFHHILLDGWSVSILFSELEKIYTSFEGVSIGYHSKVLSYENYINWISNQDFSQSKKFWCNYLLGLTSFNISNNNYLFKKKTKRIAVDYYSEVLLLNSKSKILRFCQKNRITINTFFQGIWGLLLFNYTQSKDVIFGATVSTRPPGMFDADKICGLMINTIPIRISFCSDFSIVDYFSHIQNSSIDVINNSYLPLADIRTIAKNIQCDLGDEIFETIVVVENYPVNDMLSLKVKFEDISIVDPTHYPLVLTVTMGNKLVIKFGYDSCRIDKVSILKIKCHFEQVILQILNGYSESVKKLNLLSKSEYKKIINQWNKNVIPHYSNKTINEYFEDQVNQHPSKVAVKFGDKVITYWELNGKANQLARLLIASGIKEQTFAAILLDRSIDYVISVLAILKSGAIYVPLDISHPIKRIQYILDDCSAVFLLTKLSFITHATIKKELKLILLDKLDFLIKYINADNLPSKSNNGLAYAIYTSGSTGDPKGVMVNHSSVVRLYESLKRVYDLSSRDSWTLFHSFCFDFSVWEMFGCLFSGGKLIVTPMLLTKDLEKFYELLVEEGITILNITPGAFYKLIKIDAVKNKKNLLRYVIFGGESLSKEALSSWFDRHGYATPALVNMYGITETTIFNSYHFLNSDPWPSDVCTIIGKPFSDRLIYILNEYLKPVPEGVIGEIYVGGGGVAHGYLNRKNLNEDKFIANSFLSDTSSVLYKTGDLARWLPNGTVDYVGRIDQQVKIRGFRIELGEIQSAIQKINGVSMVVVLCHSVGETKVLSAYVVKEKHSNLTLNSLKSILSGVLPWYMVPSAISFINEIPLNFNGKVDTEFLLLKKESKNICNSSYIAPNNVMQKIIANVFSEVIGFAKIDIHDSFFEMGGDSFSALELLSLLRKKIDVDIPLSLILEYPSVRMLEKGIHKFLTEKKQLSSSYISVESSSCLVPLKTTGKKSPLFLIHPVGGTVFWYTALVKYFDADQPLYGIQDPAIDAPGMKFASLEALASFYVNKIRAIQSTGPYYIGGASGGAIISIEIARQFEIAGEKIAFIGLLDGWALVPDGLRNRAIFEANMYRQFYTMQEKFSRRNIFDANQLLQFQWQRLNMLASYKFPVIKHKLTLFKALETMAVFHDVDSDLNHWDLYSKMPIEKYLVPGNHESIFEEPNVEVLAKRLGQCLLSSQRLALVGEKFNNSIFQSV